MKNTINILVAEWDKVKTDNSTFEDYFAWRTQNQKRIYDEMNQAKQNSHEHKFESKIDVIKNEFDEEQNGIISSQQASLESSIRNIEAQVVSSVMNRLGKTNGEYNDYTDIMTERQKKRYERDIELALSAFYLIIVPTFAGVIMNRRLKEFGDTGIFKLNNDVKKFITEVSGKTAESHIITILNDLLTVVKETYDKMVNDAISAIEVTRKVTDADLVLAREMALQGKSLEQIKTAVKQEYADKISTIRAKAIARTETNRAFTTSQYQADVQFIKQNSLEGKAYKKWITTSDNPCPTCVDLAQRPPIPFKENFADLGDEIITTYEVGGVTKVKKNIVNFEPLTAGNAHVNCACKYMLIIE